MINFHKLKENNFKNLDILLTVIECNNVDGELIVNQLNYDNAGNYQFQAYPDADGNPVLCWVGQHIIHATISITTNIWYSIICFFVVRIYFENRMTSTNPGARFFK